MTYIFSGTPQDIMNKFMNKVNNAHLDGLKGECAFRDALAYLVGLHGRIAKADLKESEVLKKFREESCAELVKFENKLRAYSDITLFMAEGANENEWYELCLRRSVIQILLDDYMETPVAEFINLDDVSDLDIELRRVGLEQGPIPEEFIPNGLPESHWWWHYPKESNDELTQTA